MLLAPTHFRKTGVLFTASVVLFITGFCLSRRRTTYVRQPKVSLSPMTSTLLNDFNYGGRHSGNRPSEDSLESASSMLNDFDDGGRHSGNHHSGGSLELSDALYVQSSKDSRFEVWRTPSETAFRKLRSCIGTSSCSKNQEKVIIVNSMYFRHTLSGEIGGEEIFAQSTIVAMASLGYTVIHVEDLQEAVQVYRLLPNLVRIVIVDDWDSFLCWKDKQGCLRTEQNPTGIPGHKLLSFYFWPFPRHPLGPRWVLSPEPYHLQTASESISNTTYLGYSIEESCRKQKYISPDARPSPPQAWVLAKLLSYFVPEKNQFYAWSNEDLDAIAEETGGVLMMAAGFPANPSAEETEPTPAMPDQSHYVNHGRIGQSLFMQKLAESRAVVGMGLPLISPTPWNALCLGVPYINPVDVWDQSNPEDTSRWRSQHPIAALLQEPYVYNVRKGDRQALIAAFKNAIAHPIQSYVPERMRMKSIEKRMAEIVDTDWKSEEQNLAKWCTGPCGCQLPCDADTFGDIY